MMETKGVLDKITFFLNTLKCMEGESSFSVGNFYDLYRVGQILPKLCFFTPQCMIVKGQILGRRQQTHIFFLAICYTLLFFDTLLHMTVLMVETKAECDKKLGWSALHDSLNSGGVNPEP